MIQEITNEKELNAVKDEYWQLNDKIHEMEMRQSEIDRAVNIYHCKKAADKFPDIKIGDKVRVQIAKQIGVEGESRLFTDSYEGIYAGFRIGGTEILYHPSANFLIHLDLREVKKDGTMSKRGDLIRYTDIVNIEKIS